MTRSRFLPLVVMAVLLACPAAFSREGGAPTTAPRPNIIVIVSDDHGYADLGVQGARDIKTPNIDSLAAGGVRFTNGYVSCPICSPSRAGLLTGRYQTRFGHETNPASGGDEKFGLPTSQRTLADYLKQAGYATGAVGKWHLGSRPEFLPQQRGFAEFFGFLAGAHGYMPKGIKASGNGIRRGDTPVEEKEYLTDAFSREAVSFIDRHTSEPFFLYLAYNAVHTPQHATKEKLEKYAAIQDPIRRAMAAMMESMDDGVGRILTKLREAGIEENTLVFFISDNGGPTKANSSSNAPFSGIKGQTLEGGIRVPFLVKWKSHLPAGTVYDKPVIALDILPTVLAAAGTTAPAEVEIDGVNLLPYLAKGNQGTPHERLFWKFLDDYAVREGNWKLVKSEGKPARLIDLATDPAEKSDLSSQHPDKARELQAAYDAWNAKNIEQSWKPSRYGRKGAPSSEETPEAPRRKRARK